MEDNRRFAGKYHFPFRLLCDTDRSVGLAYGACDSPSEEYAARIAVVIGPDGRVVEVHPKVNARTYPQEQLARL